MLTSLILILIFNKSQSLIISQDMYPVRIKGINYYNTPKIFEAVFSIMKVFLKDKIKNRVYLRKI
jgi:hypothetical protein